MRFIRRLLAGLNRRQQRRRNKLLTGKKSGYYDVFSDENGGGRKVCTSDETSSTEGSRLTTMTTTPGSVMPPSPWKAENFLEYGCIRETDWWKHEPVVVVESDNDDHDELDPTGTGTIQEYDGSSLTSGSATPTEAPSHHSTNQKKIFVNQGLALWQQGRDAWKSARPAVVSDTPVIRRRDPSAIPETFKTELVKCLGDRRQFELSQRIPLQTIIEAYQQVWKNEGSNNE